MPMQRWRCPVALRVKSAVFAAIGAMVAVVFFPLWFAVPVAALFAAWELAVAVRGTEVAIDTDAGVLLLRMGLIARRIPIRDVTAVLVDRAKISIARASGGEISVYAWRKSPLDGWLRIPAVAGDIGHAIASAVALAGDAAASESAGKPPASSGSAARSRSARSRSALATAVLGCTGLVAIAAARLVRLQWQNPVMTAFGALFALALGVLGLFYTIFALWLLVTGRGQRTARDRPSVT